MPTILTSVVRNALLIASGPCCANASAIQRPVKRSSGNYGNPLCSGANGREAARIPGTRPKPHTGRLCTAAPRAAGKHAPTCVYCVQAWASNRAMVMLDIAMVG